MLVLFIVEIYMKKLNLLVVFSLLLATVLSFPFNSFAQTLYAGSGYDVSYPNCGATFPTGSFGIVGVTSGRAFQYNSCFGSEYQWAASLGVTPSLYMNLNVPVGSTASNGMTGPYGNCAKKNKACQAHNYGYNAAAGAYAQASQPATMWWLDIETGNSWFSNTTLNRDVIDGATRFFTDNSMQVGIYSTASMWNKITGKYQNGLPSWVATSATSAPSSCPASFTGGSTYLVQYNNGSGFDADYSCQ